MRTDIKDRFYRTFTYQTVDRVPDVEFGYWPQTIRRWLKEGMPIKLNKEDRKAYFLGKLDKFFGFEGEGVGLDLKLMMNPPFKEEVLERRGDAVVMRDGSGTVALRYQSDVEESSIPHYIKFPVETPGDWKQMKERYRLDDPARRIPRKAIDHVRDGMRKG